MIPLKKQTAVLLVFGITLSLPAFLLLFLTSDRSNSFWISFIFLEFSIAVAAATTMASLSNTRDSFPSQISLMTFSYLYIVFVLIVNLLFSSLLRAGTKIYLSIHIIGLAAFLIVNILMLLARKSIVHQNEITYASAYEQQLLLSEIDRLKFMATRLPTIVRPSAEQLFLSFSEVVRFSDFSLDTIVSDIDNKIRSKTFNLACEMDHLIEIQADDITSLEVAVSEIKQMITFRNLQIRNEKIGI